MTTKLQKAKSNLIQMFVEEIRTVMAKKEKNGYRYKIGWVDYLCDKTGQHEFTGIYEVEGNVLMLLEADGSKAERNIRIDQVTDILRLEWILKGLHENNNDLPNA